MNKQILTTIIVALVVAVVASLITANITGNVINVAKGTAGKVYTTAEIDSKLNSLEASITNNYPACAKYVSIKNNGHATEIYLNGQYYKLGISAITPVKASLIVFSDQSSGLSVGETYNIVKTGAIIKMKSIYYDSKDIARSAVTITLNDC